MTIEVASKTEKELRHMAEERGKPVDQLVEEAIRQYLDSAAITDLDNAEVAETQMKLAPELADASSPWSDS